VLRIENLYKSFAGRMVLQNISLEIAAGSTVGLAGPSGSGKSTLLRCIQGLDPLDAGTISYAGRVGFMFQDFQLFPHMTVAQNVGYAPKLHKTLAPSVLRERIADLLAKLGIADLANRYPENLSGGQRQRAALARSLILEPDLLLCDEPTSGLDVATIADVSDLLRSIRERNSTLVIASHNLDFLTQIADRIVLLRDGTVGADIRTEKIANPVAYLHRYYGAGA
jgi:polar amino acid transport system ATP-binding protein